MPVSTPGPTTSGSWPRYCRASATTTGVRGGTTLARATASIRAGSSPDVAKRLRTSTPYSSAVCSRRVVTRQWTTSVPRSKTPRTVLVFPTSTVSSMALRRLLPPGAS